MRFWLSTSPSSRWSTKSRMPHHMGAAAAGRALQALFAVHLDKENDQLLPLLAASSTTRSPGCSLACTRCSVADPKATATETPPRPSRVLVRVQVRVRVGDRPRGIELCLRHRRPARKPRAGRPRDPARHPARHDLRRPRRGGWVQAWRSSPTTTRFPCSTRYSSARPAVSTSPISSVAPSTSGCNSSRSRSPPAGSVIERSPKDGLRGFRSTCRGDSRRSLMMPADCQTDVGGVEERIGSDSAG